MVAVVARGLLLQKAPVEWLRETVIPRNTASNKATAWLGRKRAMVAAFWLRSLVFLLKMIVKSDAMGRGARSEGVKRYVGIVRRRSWRQR
jgi:hypothetical protein